MNRETWSLAAALATMLVWGVNFAVVKFVLQELGFGAFLFIRFVVLTVLAFALLAAVFRRALRTAVPRRADLARFVACGLIGHTIHIAVVMYAMNLSTAFSSSLVLASGPLFTLFILAALGGEPLRARQIGGTLVAFAGIVVFLGEKFTRGVAQAGFGDLLLLSAAFLFALYTVIVRPLNDRYGPILVFAYTLLVGAPPLILLTLPAFLDLPTAVLTPGMWGALFFTIVMSSFFGWLAWSWVNTVRGVARSAPLSYLMPPIAGLVAWLTLGESFTVLKIAAAGVTMAGIAWAQFGGGAPRKETGQPDAP